MRLPLQVPFAGACNTFSPLHLPHQAQTLITLTLAALPVDVVQEHMASTQEPNPANGNTPAPSAGTAADVSRCTARLSAGLSRLQQYFQQQLRPSAAYQGCVLPGHVLSAAALLLGESCCWLELCLEVSRGDEGCGVRVTHTSHHSALSMSQTLPQHAFMRAQWCV
jgi:hypothetical protein